MPKDTWGVFCQQDSSPPLAQLSHLPFVTCQWNLISRYSPMTNFLCQYSKPIFCQFNIMFLLDRPTLTTWTTYFHSSEKDTRFILYVDKISMGTIYFSLRSIFLVAPFIRQKMSKQSVQFLDTSISDASHIVSRVVWWWISSIIVWRNMWTSRSRSSWRRITISTVVL